MFKRGDVVFARQGGAFPGFVKRVGKAWVDVDWGSWTKRMKPEWLVKPREVLAPGLSVDGLTAYHMQEGGEEWPLALTWCLPKREVQP